MRTQTRHLCGYVIAGVLIVLGGLPVSGSASDREVPGEVVAGPDTLESRYLRIWSAHDARKWRVGASLSALVFISADERAPLYEAHVQYRFKPRWTLDGALGISKARLDARGGYRPYLPAWDDPQPLLPAGAIQPAIYRSPQERLTLIPVRLSITYHSHSAAGMRKRGYATAGVSILSAHSKQKGKTLHGWLIGPLVGIGAEVSVHALFLVDVGITYRGAINSFQRGVGFVDLDTLALRIGIARSL